MPKEVFHCTGKDVETERHSMVSSNVYSRQAVLRQVLRFKPGSFLKSKLVATAFYYCHTVSSSSILKFCDLIVPETMRGGVEVNR